MPACPDCGLVFESLYGVQAHRRSGMCYQSMNRQPHRQENYGGGGSARSTQSYPGVGRTAGEVGGTRAYFSNKRGHPLNDYDGLGMVGGGAYTAAAAKRVYPAERELDELLYLQGLQAEEELKSRERMLLEQQVNLILPARQAQLHQTTEELKSSIAELKFSLLNQHNFFETEKNLDMELVRNELFALKRHQQQQQQQQSPLPPPLPEAPLPARSSAKADRAGKQSSKKTKGNDKKKQQKGKSKDKKTATSGKRNKDRRSGRHRGRRGGDDSDDSDASSYPSDGYGNRSDDSRDGDFSSDRGSDASSHTLNSSDLDDYRSLHRSGSEDSASDGSGNYDERERGHGRKRVKAKHRRSRRSRSPSQRRNTAAAQHSQGKKPSSSAHGTGRDRRGSNGSHQKNATKGPSGSDGGSPQARGTGDLSAAAAGLDGFDLQEFLLALKKSGGSPSVLGLGAAAHGSGLPTRGSEAPAASPTTAAAPPFPTASTLDSGTYQLKLASLDGIDLSVPLEDVEISVKSYSMYYSKGEYVLEPNGEKVFTAADKAVNGSTNVYNNSYPGSGSHLSHGSVNGGAPENRASSAGRFSRVSTGPFDNSNSNRPGGALNDKDGGAVPVLTRLTTRSFCFTPPPIPFVVKDPKDLNVFLLQGTYRGRNIFYSIIFAKANGLWSEPVRSLQQAFQSNGNNSDGLSSRGMSFSSAPPSPQLPFTGLGNGNIYGNGSAIAVNAGMPNQVDLARSLQHTDDVLPNVYISGTVELINPSTHPDVLAQAEEYLASDNPNSNGNGPQSNNKKMSTTGGRNGVSADNHPHNSNSNHEETDHLYKGQKSMPGLIDLPALPERFKHLMPLPGMPGNEGPFFAPSVADYFDNFAYLNEGEDPATQSALAAAASGRLSNAASNGGSLLQTDQNQQAQNAPRKKRMPHFFLPPPPGKSILEWKSLMSKQIDRVQNREKRRTVVTMILPKGAEDDSSSSSSSSSDSDKEPEKTSPTQPGGTGFSNHNPFGSELTSPGAVSLEAPTPTWVKQPPRPRSSSLNSTSSTHSQFSPSQTGNTTKESMDSLPPPPPARRPTSAAAAITAAVEAAAKLRDAQNKGKDERRGSASSSSSSSSSAQPSPKRSPPASTPTASPSKRKKMFDDDVEEKIEEGHGFNLEMEGINDLGASVYSLRGRKNSSDSSGDAPPSKRVSASDTKDKEKDKEKEKEKDDENKDSDMKVVVRTPSVEQEVVVDAGASAKTSPPPTKAGRTSSADAGGAVRATPVIDDADAKKEEVGTGATTATKAAGSEDAEVKPKVLSPPKPAQPAPASRTPSPLAPKVVVTRPATPPPPEVPGKLPRSDWAEVTAAKLAPTATENGDLMIPGNFRNHYMPNNYFTAAGAARDPVGQARGAAPPPPNSQSNNICAGLEHFDNLALERDGKSTVNPAVMLGLTKKEDSDAMRADPANDAYENALVPTTTRPDTDLYLDSVVGLPMDAACTRLLVYVVQTDHLDAAPFIGNNGNFNPQDTSHYFTRKPDFVLQQNLTSSSMEPQFSEAPQPVKVPHPSTLPPNTDVYAVIIVEYVNESATRSLPRPAGQPEPPAPPPGGLDSVVPVCFGHCVVPIKVNGISAVKPSNGIDKYLLRQLTSGNYLLRVKIGDPRRSQERKGPEESRPAGRIREEQKHDVDKYTQGQFESSMCAQCVKNLLFFLPKKRSECVPAAYLVFRLNSTNMSTPFFREVPMQLPPSQQELSIYGARQQAKMASKNNSPALGLYRDSTPVLRGIATPKIAENLFIDKPESMKDKGYMSGLVPYNSARGLFIRAENVRGMGDDPATYAVVVRLHGPSVHRPPPPGGSDRRVFATVMPDWMSDVGTLHFKDPPFVAQGVGYHPLNVFVVTVLKITNLTPTPGAAAGAPLPSPKVEPIGWAVNKLFLDEPNILRSGRFILPLMSGQPSPQILEELMTNKLDFVYINNLKKRSIQFMEPKGTITIGQGDPAMCYNIIDCTPFQSLGYQLLMPAQLKQEFPCFGNEGMVGCTLKTAHEKYLGGGDPRVFLQRVGTAVQGYVQASNGLYQAAVAAGNAARPGSGAAAGATPHPPSGTPNPNAKAPMPPAQPQQQQQQQQPRRSIPGGAGGPNAAPSMGRSTPPQGQQQQRPLAPQPPGGAPNPRPPNKMPPNAAGQGRAAVPAAAAANAGGAAPRPTKMPPPTFIKAPPSVVKAPPGAGRAPAAAAGGKQQPPPPNRAQNPATFGDEL